MTSTNKPPFEVTNAIYTSDPNALSHKAQLHLPAVYNKRDCSGKFAGLERIDVDNAQSLQEYFMQQLSMERLNILHKSLWIAGLARNAQPLHNHVLRGRKLVLAERADYHMLWQKDTIYLMPLPAYLLDHAIWVSYLCSTEPLFELAQGMLLSYIWLICSESDLRLAHEAGLMPQAVDWPKWINLVRATSANLSLDGRHGVNPRYIHGELRLARINWLWRVHRGQGSFTALVRGYNLGYTRYGTFFQRNTAWIVTAAIYFTVVLSAMQVGLATKQLENSAAFNNVSYGFTVFAMLAPIVGLALVFVILLILVPFNLHYALAQKKRAAMSHQNQNTPASLGDTLITGCKNVSTVTPQRTALIDSGGNI